MAKHFIYGYVFTQGELVGYARQHGLDKLFPNSNDLGSDLVKASIEDMIEKADATEHARFFLAEKDGKGCYCLALYSNTPYEDYFTRKPTRGVVKRLIQATSIPELPKWYPCPV